MYAESRDHKKDDDGGWPIEQTAQNGSAHRSQAARICAEGSSRDESEVEQHDNESTDKPDTIQPANPRHGLTSVPHRLNPKHLQPATLEIEKFRSDRSLHPFHISTVFDN